MSTDITSLIKNRRTIHHFNEEPIPEDKIILDAIKHAIWAPNHHMSEPWHFYLLGGQTKEKICKLNAEIVKSVRGDKAAEMKLQRWRNIPGWLLLTCQYSEDALRQREDYAACCCAAQNMMLYLWSIDVGVKWTTGKVTRDRRFYDVTGIDSKLETVVGLFWYGYPKEVTKGFRKPVEGVHTVLP